MMIERRERKGKGKEEGKKNKGRGFAASYNGQCREADREEVKTQSDWH